MEVNMKFSVSIRQKMPLLKQADEIFAWYNDKDGLYNFDGDPDLLNKEYVICIPKDLTNYYGIRAIDWTELKTLASKMILTLCLEDIERDAPKAKEYNIPFYWAYPVTTYEELNALSAAGVSQVLLGAPLYFDIPTAARLNIPIRLIANYCQDSIFSQEQSGIRGTFIRPEDLQLYEPYVHMIEFSTNFATIDERLNQEEGLFMIYKKGEWNGNLNLLLTNLNVNLDNRAIPPEFGSVRLKCNHKCALPGVHCNFCAVVQQFSSAINDLRHTDISNWENIENIAEKLNMNNTT